MTIKIVLPEGEGKRPCQGTRVYTESGEEIKDVVQIKMNMLPDSIIEAEVTVPVSSIENLNGIEGIVVVDRLSTGKLLSLWARLMHRIRRGAK
jgi:hypothetical protein